MSFYQALWNLPFLQYALGTGLCVGLIAPVFGQLMVLKRYSQLPDTLAHVALLGVIAGISFGAVPIVGALIVTVASSLSLEYLRQQFRVYPESLLSVMIIASISAVAIISKLNPSINRNLDQYLFGSILSASAGDLYLSIALVVVLLTGLIAFLKPIYLTLFQQDLARHRGVKVDLINLFLVVSVSLIISLGAQLLGGLLISSLLILPYMIVSQFGFNFKASLVLSSFCGVLGVLFGIYISFVLNLPVGATISSLLFVLLVLAFGFAKLTRVAN
jgi:zinc transport system permease protein